MDMDDLYDDFVSQPISVTPARLRSKIVKLLASTDIKIGEFQKMLGVNANSYGKFMQTGTNSKYKDPWSATQNGTYAAAAFFFYKEERLGKRALGKVRAHGSGAATPAKGNDGRGRALLSPAVATSVGSKTKTSAKPALPDVSGIQLESEHTWLTPSEARAMPCKTCSARTAQASHGWQVRKALQDVQLSHSTSVAGLARAAGVPYQSFNNFVKAGGAWGGKDNQAYHPAAALVERVRIALGKPKSAKRKALEAEVASGEVSRRTGGPNLGLDPDGKFYTFPGARFAKDSLGRMYIAY